MQPPDLAVYQEYHALIVEHAKRYYGNKDNGRQDPLFAVLAKVRSEKNASVWKVICGL